MAVAEVFKGLCLKVEEQSVIPTESLLSFNEKNTDQGTNTDEELIRHLSLDEAKTGTMPQHPPSKASIFSRGTVVGDPVSFQGSPGHTWRQKDQEAGLKVFSRKSFPYKTAIGIILFLLAVVIGLAAAWGVIGLEQHSAVINASCPDEWIGYLGKCYYFSEDEANWFSSLRNCSSVGATLTTIEAVQEMGFLLRYKGPIYHWIGLRKKKEKSWEWADGRVFNNTL